MDKDPYFDPDTTDRKNFEVQHEDKHKTQYTCPDVESWKMKKEILDSGKRTNYDTGAVRDIQEGKGRFDLIPWAAIWELARHCEKGAVKYGERNVDKGIPQHSLIDSSLRHLSKYLMGHKDEDHLVSAFWNIAFALYNEKDLRDMIDIPRVLDDWDYSKGPKKNNI